MTKYLIKKVVNMRTDVVVERQAKELRERREHATQLVLGHPHLRHQIPVFSDLCFGPSKVNVLNNLSMFGDKCPQKPHKWLHRPPKTLRERREHAAQLVLGHPHLRNEVPVFSSMLQPIKGQRAE